MNQVKFSRPCKFKRKEVGLSIHYTFNKGGRVSPCSSSSMSTFLFSCLPLFMVREKKVMKTFRITKIWGCFL